MNLIYNTPTTMFSESLEKGKQIEKEFVIRMIRKQLDILKIEFAPDGVFKDRDIRMLYNKNWEQKESTFEIKSDDKSLETWNICFEYMCNWQPSWIYASKADVIVYHIWWEFYRKSRARLLLDLDKMNDKKSVIGWDGNRAEMFLIDRNKFIDLFTKI